MTGLSQLHHRIMLSNRSRRATGARASIHIALIGCGLLALASPALARGHHRHHHHHHHSLRVVGLPVAGGPLVATAAHYTGRGNVTGFRGAWCGAFMGMVADRAGFHKPRDFRLARAWAHAGPRTAPKPGAIMVMPHHVGAIAKVEGGRALVISGNHSHRVGWGWYALRRAIAFVWPV